MDKAIIEIIEIIVTGYIYLCTTAGVNKHTIIVVTKQEQEQKKLRIKK